MYGGEGKKGIEYSKRRNKEVFYLFTAGAFLGIPEDITDICAYQASLSQAVSLWNGRRRALMRLIKKK